MQIKLGSIGKTVEGIEDINQEIGLILSTPLGSIPHLPDFGSRVPEYLDKPVGVARSLIVAEAYRAIKANSERFVVTKVSLVSASMGGKLVFKITGQPNDPQVDKDVILTILADYGTTQISPL